MKYKANPVVVDAFHIIEILGAQGNGEGVAYKLAIGDGQSDNQIVVATPEMCSRMKPKEGDYWVIQSDGYVYLNPKDVFERKYSIPEPNPTEPGAVKFNLYRVQYHKRRKGSAPMEPVTVFVVASSETAASSHVTAKFDPEVDEVTVYAVQSEKNNVQIADENVTHVAGGELVNPHDEEATHG